MVDDKKATTTITTTTITTTTITTTTTTTTTTGETGEKIPQVLLAGQQPSAKKTRLTVFGIGWL